ncbi:hypothetical protein, partial [Streptomyces scabiei]|uniref:hypothetical protein n=1 Tax=Streptomyces scabiei TaxID=1930 RepID=UPI0029A2738D
MNAGPDGEPEDGRRTWDRTVNVGPVAYGEKGVCRGVSARSGWRVNAPRLPASRFRAVPRTDTPRRARFAVH